MSLTSIGETPSTVAEANEYFERGLLFLRAQFDLTQARRMLDRALEIDPSFGAARAMRAITGLIAIHEGFTNDGSVVYASERDARETLATQPDLAAGHAALGAALLCSNRKEQARREFATSMRIDPRNQPSAIWTAIDDRHSGRFEMAETRLRGILADVPLFWATRIILSDVLFDQGRIDEARREIEKVFEQDAENLAATRSMARLRIYARDDVAARELLERIGAATHPNFRVRLVWALLLAHEGRAEEALAAMDAETLKYGDIALFAPAQVAEVYALAGRTDEALDWLEHAARDGDERASWFRRDAFLANLRGEARFGLILDAVEGGHEASPGSF